MFWAAFLLACLGCGETRRPTEVGCAFGETHLVARGDGSRFHALALAVDGEAGWAVWSDRGGTYARRLGPHGRPEADATRIGAPCAGGVAADATSDGLIVACLRPGDPDRDRAGHLVLYNIADEVTTMARLQPVGDRSAHPSLARQGEHTWVGWRDANVFVATARIAELSSGELTEPIALSSEETLASAPSLHFLGEQLHVAWTESWFDQGVARGHLLVQRAGSPPRPSLDVHGVDVHTFLTSDSTGPMVALRDQRTRAGSQRAFVGRLDDALRLRENDLHSPTRADSRWGRPQVVPCGEHVFSVATRRSSREVTMVTVRRLNEALEPAEAEHQIYEYHARFPQAVAGCVEGRLLMVVGEQQSEAQRVPRLRTYELRCAPGQTHARTPGTEGRVRGTLEP